jgi:hypothetical protein
MLKITLYILPLIWLIKSLHHNPSLQTVSKAAATYLKAQHNFFFLHEDKIVNT